MSGYGPSTSGRMLEGSFSRARAALVVSRSVTAPQTRLLRRCARERVVTCQAIALPGRLRLLKVLHQLFRSPQETQAEHLLLEVDIRDEDNHATAQPAWGRLVKKATFAAIQVGVRLTGIAFWLAKTVVEDIRRSARRIHIQQQVQQSAKSAKQLLDPQTLRRLEAQREALRLQGRDVAFMKMLHILDRSHVDHDAKWALVQKHTADKADFCQRLQQLYKAACDSKEAVETLLRPDASRAEVNRFWKSQQTAALIAEEESLKQLVFAQMLQAS